MLEWGLDRPVVNGRASLLASSNFEVKGSCALRAAAATVRAIPMRRMREQLGLVIVPARRNVETTVYRLR